MNQIDEIIRLMRAFIGYAGNAKKALSLVNGFPNPPRRQRKAIKFMKKYLRAMIRIEQGRAVCPISAKYYK